MKNLLRILLNQFHSHLWDSLATILIAVAILMLVKQYLDTQSDEDWAKFVAEHQCTASKFKDDKQLKSGWVCNDGKEYFRWRQQL